MKILEKILNLILRKNKKVDPDAPTISIMKGYKLMWPFIKKYLWLTILGIILTVPVGTLDAFIALFLKPFMDNVMVDKQEELASNVPFIIVGFVMDSSIRMTLVWSYSDFTMMQKWQLMV